MQEALVRSKTEIVEYLVKTSTDRARLQSKVKEISAEAGYDPNVLWEWTKAQLKDLSLKLQPWETGAPTIVETETAPVATKPRRKLTPEYTRETLNRLGTFLTLSHNRQVAELRKPASVEFQRAVFRTTRLDKVKIAVVENTTDYEIMAEALKTGRDKLCVTVIKRINYFVQAGEPLWEIKMAG